MKQESQIRGVNFFNEVKVTSEKLEGRLFEKIIFTLDNNYMNNCNMVNNELVLEMNDQHDP